MPGELRVGRLYRDDKPFFAVGVNYHPSSVGCRIWQDWRVETIERDLTAIAAAGLNTVRFFVYWRDVEPTPAHVDDVVLGRIRRFVEIADRHNLVCLPSLLTIFMNGQLLDVPWRDSRGLWRDDEIVTHAAAHVARVARTLSDLDNVLAYDLGDELLHVDPDEAASLTRDEVAAWQGRMAAAVRRAHPGALVLQANEASAVTGQHAFGPHNLGGLDLTAVHGYPLWAPFAIESNRSETATRLVPYLVRTARPFGPVIVDEVGAYGAGPATAAGYLRAVTRAAAAAGAQGVIAWCWQDIADRSEPFASRPGEAAVGLTDCDGKPKPALAELSGFAAEAADVWAHGELERPVVAVRVAPRTDPPASYLDGATTGASGEFYAHVLATRAHLPFAAARVPSPDHQLFVCPSVQRVSHAELERLEQFVTAGGTVLYSSGEPLHGFGGERLFGVGVEDFAFGGAGHGSFTWRGVTYPLEWPADAKAPVLAATTAEVLAMFEDGTPAFTRRRVGNGAAYYLACAFEAQLDRPGRLAVAPWERLYREIAADAGVVPSVDCDSPEVEVRLLTRGAQLFVLAINHAAHPVTASLTSSAAAAGASHRIVLDTKGTELLAIGRTARAAEPLMVGATS